MSRLTPYDNACKKIRELGCEPLFTKDEWMGSRKDKTIMKYWFKGKCGHEFYRSYDMVTSGQIYCNECGKKHQIEKQKLTKSEFDNYSNIFTVEKNIKIITEYKDYKNYSQKLKCECLLCNKIFYESLRNLTRKDSHGCETMSKGERIVMTMLEKNGIDYNYQVYINELNLTSDFEIKLIDGDLIHLEVDGDQHYDYPNQFHKTYEDFLKAQERDKVKDAWYASNGCKNIHIRYNVGGKKNDNIKLILKYIINNKYGECKTKEINPNFNIIDIARKSTKNKKVIAYTLDGNFYGIYESMLQAEKELGVDNACISACVNQRKNTKRAGNYIFRLYENNYPTKIEAFKELKCKPILIFQDGIFIEEIKSLSELVNKYDIPKSSLSRYLNGKGNNPSKDNYDFKYKSA